jgi:hypothetical protein
MKKTCCKFLVIILLLVLPSCDSDSVKGVEIFSETYDFARAQNEWVAGFSDFPTGDSAAYELKYGYTEEPLSGQKSLMITGKNLNRDLFMFYKRKLAGFRPDTEYILTFEVQVSTDMKVALAGTNESVYLKVGATAHEPKAVIDDGQYVMNLDKGNGSVGGQDMLTIGDIAPTTTSSSGYTLVSRSNAEIYSTPCIVRTGSSGELWLIMGTDSGYEGTTTLYYTKVSVIFSASN